jgi:hypothetical protein
MEPLGSIPPAEAGQTLLPATQRYLCCAGIDLNQSASTVTGGGLTEILYFNFRSECHFRPGREQTAQNHKTRPGMHRDASMRMLQRIDHYLYYRSVAWLYLFVCNCPSSRELLQKTYKNTCFFHLFLPIIITIIGVAPSEPRFALTDNPDPFVRPTFRLIAVKLRTPICLEL